MYMQPNVADPQIPKLSHQRWCLFSKIGARRYRFLTSHSYHSCSRKKNIEIELFAFFLTCVSCTTSGSGQDRWAFIVLHKYDIESEATSSPMRVVSLFRSSHFAQFACVELVATMSDHRVCDMCMQPYAGRGEDSNCSLFCPSRRGFRRRDVAHQLGRSHIDNGLHPQSRLILEAQGRLTMQGQTSATEIRVIESRITELQDRLRILEQERDAMRRVLPRMVMYSATGRNPDNQHSNASQPESEP